MSDKEMERLLSQQDIRTFAESLIRHLYKMAGVFKEESKSESNTILTLPALPRS